MWIAISIGCIECGAENTPEEILSGVFSTREEAHAAISAEIAKNPGYWARTVGEDQDHFVSFYREDDYGWRGSDSQIRLVEIR